MSEKQQRFGLPDGSMMVDPSTREAQQVLAGAYAERVRPRCLCAAARPQMYIAKVAGRFVIKRMPDTGVSHAISCDSYLPPEHLSGLGQVLGHAIEESPEADRTALRLGFSLSVSDRAAPVPSADPDAAPDTVSADGTKLTLRAVLHYLWDEAGLSTWSPAMRGKRSWRVISWHLRQAAAGKYVKGAPLGERMFIPEPWSKDRATQLKTARMQAWRAFQPASGKTQKLLLLVGEVKEFGQARYGPKVVIKHLPDALITLEDKLMGRLSKRFGFELETWEADEDIHLMIAATATISRSGVATLKEATLVLVDQNWLPIDSPEEQVLVDAAVEERRRFRKALRYNLSAGKPMASIVLTDTPAPTGCYLVTDRDDPGEVEALAQETGTGCWTWSIDQPFPTLPDRGQSRPASTITSTAGAQPDNGGRYETQAAPSANTSRPTGRAEEPPLEEPPDGLWPLEDSSPDPSAALQDLRPRNKVVDLQDASGMTRSRLYEAFNPINRVAGVTQP